MTAQQSFERKFIIEPFGCWRWRACKSKSGYGKFSIRINGVAKSYRAHRFSMHIYKGFDLNSSELVLHKSICTTRLCVNPEHLYIGTQKDNVRDQVIEGIHHESRKTHCTQEHEYSKENT